MEDMGPLIRSVRESAGLTQGEIAQLAGVTRQTVARIETDTGDTTLRNLANVAKALGLRLELQSQATDHRADTAQRSPLEKHLAEMASATEALDARRRESP